MFEEVVEKEYGKILSDSARSKNEVDYVVKIAIKYNDEISDVLRVYTPDDKFQTARQAISTLDEYFTSFRDYRKTQLAEKYRKVQLALGWIKAERTGIGSLIIYSVKLTQEGEKILNGLRQIYGKPPIRETSDLKGISKKIKKKIDSLPRH